MPRLHRLAFPATALAALLALAEASPARATTVDLPSLDELCRASEVVARVRVLEQQVEHAGHGQRGRARTWTTLVVVDAVAGATTGERLVLYQPGDAATGEGGVLGQPRHRPGDDVVVFLARARVGGRDAVIHRGLGYGLYDVGVDGALNERAADVARVPSAAGPLPARWSSTATLRDAVLRARSAVRP
ncbi:MAG: hypothetical protein HYS27_06020 [Deltaproteobacteria bacterium]|nr:hypothetical protein [Deltaproteobacteria bacterium]